MPFTFKIEKPKVESKRVFMKLEEMIERENGSISGDHETGTIISSDGVEGSYVVGEEFIEITIYKKPCYYAEFAVEKYIRDVFREAST